MNFEKRASLITYSFVCVLQEPHYDSTVLLQPRYHLMEDFRQFADAIYIRTATMVPQDTARLMVRPPKLA